MHQALFAGMVVREAYEKGVHLQPERITSSADKHTVWEHKLNEMEQLRDGMGKGLDQHIKETVAVLQLFGVHTQHSCEGHLDHGVAAPWIDIQSPDLRLEEFFRHYGALCEKADVLEAVGEVADAVYDEIYAIRKEIDRIEAREYRKLIPYLEEFYRGRNVSYERRLIIDPRGRLTCQGGILQPAEEKETQALRLKKYQDEMRAFTEFLKNKFFACHSCNP